MYNEALQTIRRLSWTAIGLLFLLTAGFALLHQQGYSLQEANRINSMIALLGTAVFAVAAPILIRTLSYQKSLKDGGMSVADFRKMKLLSLVSVCLGAFFALYAFLVPVYKYHLYLSFLLGIYGIYSILPMQQNDKRDIKGFGVRDEQK